jgi:NADH-quinone oxidoreductase subunit L
VSDLAFPLWLIPALPLAASVLIAFLGPRWLRGQSHWPSVLGIAASCVLSVLVLIAVANRPAEEPPIIQQVYTLFDTRGGGAGDAIAAGDMVVDVRLRADSLTAIMLVTVTFVATFIAVYSAGYMHGDPGYPRYFAEISLFVFSMTGLVLADNFLLLYAFWEGVGLCSYLLIGFWFTRPAAAAAARKAFLVTRLGDLGFLIGIIVLWFHSGYHLNYEDTLYNSAVLDKLAARPELLATIALLLFCGAVGKSAQFPLHVWLPDAMEGPSPVSALIHAATMVTAGVYLVARCMPLFRPVPEVLLVVACIGAFTALLAALIALTQNDLKRILAYSTISQLGYMFLALGCATVPALVPVAVAAAILHLFTHAFFKALLFLAAGSVMHAMGDVIDIRRFSGLHRLLPITHATFLCGALALAGVFPFAGFWSKDEILGAVLGAHEEGCPFHAAYLVLFIVGLVTAGLTAFYTSRAYFRTFWGPERVPPEAGPHAHESPPVMWVPLAVLAVGAFGAGFLAVPFTDFLGRTPGVGEVHEHETHWFLIGGSTLVALAGIGVAAGMYARVSDLPDRLARGAAWLYQLSLNRFHLDELYDFFIIKPATGVAAFCRIFDQYVLDSLIDLVAQVPRVFGLLFRPMQNGLVQFYALAMLLGLTAFLVALARVLAG